MIYIIWYQIFWVNLIFWGQYSFCSSISALIKIEDFLSELKVIIYSNKFRIQQYTLYFITCSSKTTNSSYTQHNFHLIPWKQKSFIFKRVEIWAAECTLAKKIQEWEVTITEENYQMKKKKAFAFGWIIIVFWRSMTLYILCQRNLEVQFQNLPLTGVLEIFITT